MSTLTVYRGQPLLTMEFDEPQPLSALLVQAGLPMEHPCGGRGVCGKCAVVLEGAVSGPNAEELRCGSRLACQTMVYGDSTVFLPETQALQQIDAGSLRTLVCHRPMPGRTGAAIDIGTTTLALRLYDLTSGMCVAVTTMTNPHIAIAADVIGRIEAAMKGDLHRMRESLAAALQTMLRTACTQAECDYAQVESMVITGNTTMLYLLTERDPQSLSKAPFEADCHFGNECLILDKHCYLPPCPHAFVGADTTCALLASGMLEHHQTELLCDIGTNGEIALWHKGQLYIASTAAGPAFEGAGISCGCSSIPGAIDHVVIRDGTLHLQTIAKLPPLGLCGSGLIDAVASLLELEVIDETGAMSGNVYALTEKVSLTQQDIRALQLAKAAIMAGIRCLLRAAGCEESEITTVYLAGGFGRYLNMESAVRIGLIPPTLADRVCVIGNAAVDGAALLLTNIDLRDKADRIKKLARHIRLDGNAYFSTQYMESMMFGTDMDSF